MCACIYLCNDRFHISSHVELYWKTLHFNYSLIESVICCRHFWLKLSDCFLRRLCGSDADSMMLAAPVPSPVPQTISFATQLDTYRTFPFRVWVVRWFGQALCICFRFDMRSPKLIRHRCVCTCRLWKALHLEFGFYVGLGKRFSFLSDLMRNACSNYVHTYIHTYIKLYESIVTCVPAAFPAEQQRQWNVSDTAVAIFLLLTLRWLFSSYWW